MKGGYFSPRKAVFSIPSFSAVSYNLVFFETVSSLTDFSNAFRFISDSFWAFLNSPTELPMDRTSSGILFAPKRSITTTKIITSSSMSIVAYRPRVVLMRYFSSKLKLSTELCVYFGIEALAANGWHN